LSRNPPSAKLRCESERASQRPSRTSSDQPGSRLSLRSLGDSCDRWDRGGCWAHHRPRPYFFRTRGACGPRVASQRLLFFALFFSLLHYPSFDPPQLALRFPRTKCLSAPSPSSTSPPVVTIPNGKRCLPRSRSSRRRSSWVAPGTTLRAALWVARLASPLTRQSN